MGAELENRKKYNLRVLETLLVQAQMAGIDPNNLIEFFGEILQQMPHCKPNLVTADRRIWYVRGYYPGSQLFFKLSLVDHVANIPDYRDRNLMWAKASPLVVKGPGYGNNREGRTTIRSEAMEDHLTNKMENTLLGANHKLRPFYEKKFKMPRCASPKGMKLFRPAKTKKK